MNKYIYTIILTCLFILNAIIFILNAIADEKQKEYLVNEYKKVQASNTELVKENKELKEENNAFRSVIDTYNIPNNLDARFEVE